MSNGLMEYHVFNLMNTSFIEYPMIFDWDALKFHKSLWASPFRTGYPLLTLSGSFGGPGVRVSPRVGVTV